MPEEADGGLTPASDAGSEFVGDLGLPTPADTGEEQAGDPEGAAPTAPQDSSDGIVTEGTGATQSPTGSTDPDAETAVVAEAYKAVGRDWESEAAFAQHYKSLEGRVRAQGQEQAKLNNLVDQWENWHAHVQSEAKAKPAPVAAAGNEAKPEPYLDAIDWAAVKRLNADKGIESAMQAVVIGLQDHIEKEVVGRMESKIAEVTAPMREEAAVKTADTEAKQWFYNTAMGVDPESGAPIFPELYEGGDQFDPKLATDIVNSWGTLVRSHPEFGLTADGMAYAVAVGKAVASRRVAPAQDAAKVAQQVTRNAQGQFVKKAEAAIAEEATGGVDTTEVVGEASTVNEAEKARRDIRNAGKGDDKSSFFGIA